MLASGFDDQHNTLFKQSELYEINPLARPGAIICEKFNYKGLWVTYLGYVVHHTMFHSFNVELLIVIVVLTVALQEEYIVLL